MSEIRHAHLWQVWGYPDDPDWDGGYDIGFTTEGGTGNTVATGLTRENAEYIVRLAHRAAASESKRDASRQKAEPWQETAYDQRMRRTIGYRWPWM